MQQNQQLLSQIHPHLGTAPRLGLLGGTFDPIHIGHLSLAQAAQEELGLDQVLFIPAGNPPHKQGKPVTEAEHRLCMVELAVSGNPDFEVSTVDMARQGPSYTVDTLRQLRQVYPRHVLVFIIGADSLLDIARWHKPREILAQCHVAAAERPGFDLARTEKAMGELYDLHRERIHLFSAPLLEISSTRLRELCFEGRSIRYLAPDPVVDYIAQHRLYSGRDSHDS